MILLLYFICCVWTYLWVLTCMCTVHIYYTGEGALGISVPGCSETFEEPAKPRFRQGHRRRSSHSHKQQQQLQDSHQKIRHFKEGDILAIPPGLPYWTYNYGDQQIVAVSLLDTSSSLNQLDSNPRVSTFKY